MIVVDPRSPTPPFEQVRAQLADQIRSGALAPGTRLPTVRRLAEDLGLAVNTIARAYRELETGNLVQARSRNGTTVTWSPDDAQRQLQATAACFASQARDLGLPAHEARHLIERALGLA